MTWFALGAAAATGTAILLMRPSPAPPPVSPERQPVMAGSIGESPQAAPVRDDSALPTIIEAAERPRPVRARPARYTRPPASARTETRIGVSVAWQTLPANPYYYHYRVPAGERARDLARRARGGDGEAAFALYRDLSWCGGLRVATRVRAASLFAMSSPYAYPGTMDSQAGVPAAAQTAACAQAHELGAAEDWLAMAARFGNVDALLQVALLEFPSAEAVTALEQMWLAGDPRATILLARAHRDGWSDGDLFVAPDPASALAYDMLGADLLPHADPQGHNPIFERSLNTRVHNNARGMDAKSLAAATTMARSMLEGNESCCTRPGTQPRAVPPAPPAQPDTGQ